MKTIHINANREAESNPDMEFPVFNAWRDSDEVRQQAIQRWLDGCVKFEDENVKYYLPVKARYVTHHEPQDEEYLLTSNNRDEAMRFGDEVLLKPNTFHQVDIEWEVVAQLKTVSGNWVDTYGGIIPECELENPILEYRRVLRIKQK